MHTASIDPRDIDAWISAAHDDTVRAELRDLYSRVREEIDARAPACWASGRCCNFRGSGHLLYVTGLEAAATLLSILEQPADTPSPGRSRSLPQLPARDRPDCPFLGGNLCTIHDHKPLACRTYFCDRSATAWQNDLTERGMTHLRELHERRNIPYVYAEWRLLLDLLTPRL